MIDNLLNRRHVIVTGGSRGIGAAIALELLRQKASVTIVARDKNALEKTAASLADETDGDIHVVEADVTNVDNAEKIIAESAERMGGLDALVNNAGANTPIKIFLELSRNEFEKMIALNFTAAVDLTRAALKRFVKEEKGDILNIASLAGKKGVPMWSPYCSAKHALIGFSKTIAHEYAEYGIRCNVICPGFVRTDMLSKEHLEQWADGLGITRQELLRDVILKMTPQRRFVQAESIAKTAVFLLSEAASDITGQSVNVSCGLGEY